MMRARVRRKALYGATLLSCLAVAFFAARAILDPEDIAHRVWLMVWLMIGGCQFTASLFVFFIEPIEKAWRLGYEAGQRASGCSMFRPVLSTLEGGARTATNATVTPLRVMHTDN